MTSSCSPEINTSSDGASFIRTPVHSSGEGGGSDVYTIHWCAALKMWALFQELDNRYWNCFGIARPDPEKALQITVEVNPPLEGMDRKVGGAFARDPHAGDIYFVHRGRIGGGQKGIGA